MLPTAHLYCVGPERSYSFCTIFVISSTLALVFRLEFPCFRGVTVLSFLLTIRDCRRGDAIGRLRTVSSALLFRDRSLLFVAAIIVVLVHIHLSCRRLQRLGRRRHRWWRRWRRGPMLFLRGRRSTWRSLGDRLHWRQRGRMVRGF